MKHINTRIESTQIRKLILTTALALAVGTVACAKQSAQTAELKTADARPSQAAFKQVSAQAMTIASDAGAALRASDLKASANSPVKQPVSKTLSYKSRDYGVSFEYPWQYQFASARKISNDEGLQPKSDGFEGQITLARIDLPKGFYPDTDFDSGYFTLGLNSEVEEKDCAASVTPANSAAQVAKIGDVEFAWKESEAGGKGTASKIRNYAAFNNGVCYEIELGVKTRNEDGLAHEVNANQVMRKLEGMLKTVKFAETATKPEGQK